MAFHPKSIRHLHNCTVLLHDIWVHSCLTWLLNSRSYAQGFTKAVSGFYFLKWHLIVKKTTSIRSMLILLLHNIWFCISHPHAHLSFFHLARCKLITYNGSCKWTSMVIGVNGVPAFYSKIDKIRDPSFG